MALKNRIELRIASKDIEHSKEQIKEAKSFYYPRLNLNAGYTHFNKPITFDVDIDIRSAADPYNNAIRYINSIYHTTFEFMPNALHQELTVGKTDWATLSLNLTQPLYTFDRIEEAVKQAKTAHAIAENQKDKKRLEIITEVKRAYYQYLFLKEMFGLLSEAEVKAGVVSKMVKIAYETSTPDRDDKGTTRVDYLQARNFHSEIKSKLVEANNALESAEIALKYALGIPLDGALSLKEAPLESIPTTQFDSKEIGEAALQRNADLRTVKLGVQLYDSKKRAAKKEYLPKIGVQGQYIGPEDRFGIKNSWFVGIGLDMTLFDGFSTRAKVAQSQIQSEKVKDQAIALEKAISAQASSLHKTLIGLKDKMEILRTGIKEAQERINLAAEGYSAGMIEYEKFLNSQKTELEMRSAYLQSLFLFHNVKSELEFVSGVVKE